MELAQAETAARAARDAGVEHLIWSTLEDTRPFFAGRDDVPSLDDGRYKVPHFDAKGEADALFTKYGVPTTFLRTTFYFDSLISGMEPVRNADGKLILNMPMADQPLSGIASEDIGRTALGIFKPRHRPDRPDRQHRRRPPDRRPVRRSPDRGPQDTLGEDITYQPLTWDEFRALQFPLAVEIANMFQFYAEDSARFTGDRDLTKVRDLNPALQSLEDWLTKHKRDFKLEPTL